jgi:Flp pilus assembly protein TadB
MEKVWTLLAAGCVIAAVVFFWFHNIDAAFVAAVLGCVAWLLNYRTGARKRVAENAPKADENA